MADIVTKAAREALKEHRNNPEKPVDLCVYNIAQELDRSADFIRDVWGKIEELDNNDL